MFYWISWSIWVYLTFFLKKENKYRLKFSAAVLLSIILANIHISFGMFEINLSGLFLLMSCYATLYGEKRKMIIYFYICSSILTIVYVTFSLFEIFDPAWLIFKKEWMLGICISYLAIL